MDRYNKWRKLVFSDINNFNLNNFVFLTYSISGPTQRDFFKSTISNSNIYDRNQDFDVSLNPIKLRMKRRISVSLTTSNDFYTYGRIGYIISAPVENILYVGQASFSDSNNDLRKKALRSPNDIFLGNVLFNEVVLEGSTYYGDIKPIAIFINLTDATEIERFQVERQLEKIREATFDLYSILDLSRNKTLKDSSEKFK